MIPFPALRTVQSNGRWPLNYNYTLTLDLQILKDNFAIWTMVNPVSKPSGDIKLSEIIFQNQSQTTYCPQKTRWVTL